MIWISFDISDLVVVVVEVNEIWYIMSYGNCCESGKSGKVYDSHSWKILFAPVWCIWDVVDFLTDILSNRKKGVVGQHSSWVDIKSSLPQGSILGH